MDLDLNPAPAPTATHPKIIAFCGPAGVGKSTASAKLAKLTPLKTVAISMAEPIKAMLAVILPEGAFLPENKEKPEWGILGKSPRELARSLGTEWGRTHVHPNIWPFLSGLIIKKLSSDTLVTIDDIRYDNEAEVVKENHGVIVELYRAGVNYNRQHATEIGISSHLIDLKIDLDAPDADQQLAALLR